MKALCCSGVSALLLVALEGTNNLGQLQMVEFGRGFGYKVPLSISMPSVGSTILKQIVSVWSFRWTWTQNQTLTPDCQRSTVERGLLPA